MLSGRWSRIEVAVDEAGVRAHSVTFEGRWLVGPDEEASQSRTQPGTCYAIAEEPDGHFVVYRFDLAGTAPRTLTRYRSLADAVRDGVPLEIAALAAARAGDTTLRSEV